VAAAKSETSAAVSSSRTGNGAREGIGETLRRVEVIVGSYGAAARGTRGG
jgi:hypothetical protein